MKKSDVDRSPIMMRKLMGGLVPSHSYDAERLDAYTTGRDLEVTIRQRRSPRQNRQYWVALKRTIEAAETDYPTTEHLHEALKMTLGYVRLIKRLDGSVVAVPDSTAFAAMDGAAFRVYFDQALDVLRRRYGFDPLALEREDAA